MTYWLIKSEPASYGWTDLVRDGGTEWDGVRNAAAAGHLRDMRVDDELLFYHSGKEKQAVGIARVMRTAKAEGENGRWVSVRVEPVRALARPVTLAAMKSDPELGGMAMLRQARLSVSPVDGGEWARVMEMAAER